MNDYPTLIYINNQGKLLLYNLSYLLLTVIKKSNYMICQFASPVEIVDIHKQPEVSIIALFPVKIHNLICFIFRLLFWKENTGKENLMQ